MILHITQKYKRGRYILQKEGRFALFVKVVRFLKRCVFIDERYDMYELTLNEPMKFEPTLKIKNPVFEIIMTSQRFKELVAKGFGFGIHGLSAREKLVNGAIMSCVFVDKELACVNWAAITQEAMKVQIKIPYKVDFSNSEVYLGWVETNPQYRHLGLSLYAALYLKFKLETMGKTTGKCIVERGNLASQKRIIKIGGKLYGKGRYLKILWWKYWREKPTVQQASIERTVVK